jgi:hypothetical protein
MPFPLRPKNILKPKQEGSILIALLAVLVLLSVMMTLGVDMFKTPDPADRGIETRKKMEMIADRLSVYAQNNYRLPCPSDANGIELRSGGNAWTGACTNPYGDVTRQAIIPYRTLGLDIQDARDEWGNFFTYAVSPAFTDFVTPALSNAGAPRTEIVSSQCRTGTTAAGAVPNGSWIVNSRSATVHPTVARNINPAKALFCCPSTAATTDIVIRRTGTTPSDPSPYNAGSDRTINNPQFMNSPATPPAHTTATSEGWAYVLISHGANGTAPSAAEAENFESNNVLFNDYPKIYAEGANYFDDILIYRTQHQVMGELAPGSCRTPFYSYQHTNP